MKLITLYLELEESEVRANFVKDSFEVEECLNTTISLYNEITSYKYCIKNGGLEKVFKKVAKNAVSVAEVKEMLKNKERDLIANLKFLEKATKIERVKILNWLNINYLTNLSNYNEKEVVLSLALEINKIQQEKQNYLI